MRFRPPSAGTPRSCSRRDYAAFSGPQHPRDGAQPPRKDGLDPRGGIPHLAHALHQVLQGRGGFFHFRKGHVGQICVGRTEVRACQPQDVADLGEGVIEGLQVLDKGEMDHVARAVEAEAALSAAVRRNEPLFLPELDRADIDAASFRQLSNGKKVAAGDVTAFFVLDRQTDASLDLLNLREGVPEGGKLADELPLLHGGFGEHVGFTGERSDQIVFRPFLQLPWGDPEALEELVAGQLHVDLVRRP